MNNVDNFLKKFTQTQIAAEIAAESKSNFEKLLKTKVFHLYRVGNSVLRKQLGSERYNNLESNPVFSEISQANSWLLVRDPKIEFEPWKTDSRRANLRITGVTSKGNYISYSISASLLTKSDRDFAKDIRKTQRIALEKIRHREIEWAKSILERSKLRELKNQKNSDKKDKVRGNI